MTLATATTEHYCRTRQQLPIWDKIVPLSLRLGHAQDVTIGKLADPTRQHQPGHRSGMGLADARRRRGAVQRAGQGYGELHLQGCHRPAVGRSEHAKPLHQQRPRRSMPARRSCAQTPRRRRTASRSTPSRSIPAGMRSLPCSRNAPAVRTSSTTSRSPTRPRRCSIRSASRSPSCASRNNRAKAPRDKPRKKPGRNGRAFYLRISGYVN